MEGWGKTIKGQQMDGQKDEENKNSAVCGGDQE